MMKTRALCMVLLLLSAVACGGGQSSVVTSPSLAPTSGLNLSGTWNGTLAEVRAGDNTCPNSWVGEYCGIGDSTLTLVQSGSAVSGTFSLKMACAGCDFDVSQGSVTGTLSGGTLSYTLNVGFSPQRDPPLKATVNGTAQVTTTNMSGIYDGFYPGLNGNTQPSFGMGQLALVKH